MNARFILKMSPVYGVIVLAAAAKFAVHLISAPGYGFFFDELYTMALSRHLAFGYVDLPPLVPALMALSRAVLGESILAMHIVPALAGAFTLVFVCLMTREFGGKIFAVSLSALGFLFVPLWLGVDSIFCYDSIDQMVLAGFLYTLIRFLRTGNRKLWLLLGVIAGLAGLTKMTILFLGPGFLIALLFSKFRKDLLTPWPWLGALLCLVVVSPYLFWQMANGWPTLEYWNNYGANRVYEASAGQYLTNILAYMGVFLLPLWGAGLYRIFRRLAGVNYRFLGVLFLCTLALMFFLHASTRMLAELFMPLIAAGAVFFEEILSGARWKIGARAAALVYVMVTGLLLLPASLPILPMESFIPYARATKMEYQSIREFNGGTSYAPLLLTGRLGWEEFVRDVAGVYASLPEEERAVAGIFTNEYATAGAIDLLGPRHNLPHAVSGSLTYYLWGPGYTWDVMIIIAGRTNPLAMFFGECTQAATTRSEYNPPLDRLSIFVCRKPKIPAETIWGSMKNFR